MFNVTKSAQDAIKSFNKDNKPFLRVAVTGGGCAGLIYKLSYEDNKTDIDTVITFGDVNIIQDFKSSIFLEFVTIDYKNELNESGFVYTNSQQKGGCGCGQSFSL